MKQIKKTLIISFALFITVSAFAQQNNKRPIDREKIKAAKVAFLTNRLDLTSKQAEKFWPLFNEYEEEKGKLSRMYNGKKRELIGQNGLQNISDENANQMLDIYFEQKEKEMALEKTYVKRFMEVLEPIQAWKIIRFEGEFRRMLMQQLRGGGNFPNKNNRRKGN